MQSREERSALARAFKASGITPGKPQPRKKRWDEMLPGYESPVQKAQAMQRRRRPGLLNDPLKPKTHRT